MALSQRYLIGLSLALAHSVGIADFGATTARAASTETPSANPPATPADSANSRTFSVIAGANADWSQISYQSASGNYTPLTINRQTRSALQAALASGEWELTRTITDPLTKQTTHRVIARTAWPKTVRNALFILIPKATPDAGGLEFNVIACDDSPIAFPAETARVVNATPATLTGRIGRDQVELPPGVSKGFSTSEFISTDEEKDTGMPVGLAIHLSDGWKPLYDAPLSVSAGTRVLIIVLPPKAGGSTRIQVRAIHQTLPANSANGTSVAANR